MSARGAGGAAALVLALGILLAAPALAQDAGEVTVALSATSGRPGDEIDVNVRQPKDCVDSVLTFEQAGAPQRVVDLGDENDNAEVVGFGTYTIASRDLPGAASFVHTCGDGRSGSAPFEVLVSDEPTPLRPLAAPAGVPVPTRVDTGAGGAADRGAARGLLLPGAALAALAALAAGRSRNATQR